MDEPREDHYSHARRLMRARRQHRYSRVAKAPTKLTPEDIIALSDDSDSDDWDEARNKQINDDELFASVSKLEKDWADFWATQSWTEDTSSEMVIEDKNSKHIQPSTKRSKLNMMGLKGSRDPRLTKDFAPVENHEETIGSTSNKSTYCGRTAPDQAVVRKQASNCESAHVRSVASTRASDRSPLMKVDSQQKYNHRFSTVNNFPLERGLEKSWNPTSTPSSTFNKFGPDKASISTMGAKANDEKTPQIRGSGVRYMAETIRTHKDSSYWRQISPVNETGGYSARTTTNKQKFE